MSATSEAVGCMADVLSSDEIRRIRDSADVVAFLDPRAGSMQQDLVRICASHETLRSALAAREAEYEANARRLIDEHNADTIAALERFNDLVTERNEIRGERQALERALNKALSVLDAADHRDLGLAAEQIRRDLAADIEKAQQ